MRIFMTATAMGLFECLGLAPSFGEVNTKGTSPTVNPGSVSVPVRTPTGGAGFQSALRSSAT